MEISKNDIFKNLGNALELRGVEVFNNEIKRVYIRENLVQENVAGNGIYVERSSCHIESNEIIMSDDNGIMVTSKAGIYGSGTTPCIV